VTLLVEVALDGQKGFAVYKPLRGERPLWDFPPGLYKREIAAWELSEALGWGLVPRTIRRDGPFGEGSLQRFIDADFDQHYFTLREEAAHHEQLRRICAFDLVSNNADRKSGHLLLAPDATIYGIDNGLCFHVDPKLRTVIWDFAGEPIPSSIVADLSRLLAGGLPRRLKRLLERDECLALLGRMQALIRAKTFPADDTGYRYPWPLV
jgi:uncharacterized repeat protein (TIGR03843 family)